MDKIKSVLEGIYKTPSLRKSVVPLFIGKTGIGKTSIIKDFIEEKNGKVIEFITSQMNPMEISGMIMPSEDRTQMKYLDFDKLETLEDGDFIFFDELLNGNPVVLNACLTFLGNRATISGKKLPDVMIIAAANKEGMCPLTPQIKERFKWYDVEFNSDMFIEKMIDKHDITRDIGKELSKLIIAEDFSKYNFNTPRSIDIVIDMLINDVVIPKEYKKVEYILLSPIENTTDNAIELYNGKVLEKGAFCNWLDLIKTMKYEDTKK